MVGQYIGRLQFFSYISCSRVLACAKNRPPFLSGRITAIPGDPDRVISERPRRDQPPGVWRRSDLRRAHVTCAANRPYLRTGVTVCPRRVGKREARRIGILVVRFLVRDRVIANGGSGRGHRRVPPRAGFARGGMAREAREVGIVRDRLELRQDPAVVDEPRRRRRDARGHPEGPGDDRGATLGADDREVKVHRARLLRAGGCPRPVRVLRLPHRAPAAGEPG